MTCSGIFKRFCSGTGRNEGPEWELENMAVEWK